MNFPFAARNKNLSNAMWAMSPHGKRKYESAMNGETVTIKILEYLSDNGASSTSEIAQGLGANPRRMERILQTLERQHYIMQTGGDDEA